MSRLKKDKVGYLGPEASTFGYVAAEQFFDADKVELTPFKTHREICNAVGKKAVKYGVVAIENVINSVVPETALACEDAAEHYGLAVCGEVLVPIELFYMRRPGEEKIEKVLSHTAAFNQCQEKVVQLRTQGIITENRDSTGEAAKEASESPGIAAIASSRAETLYGLERIEKDSVADNKKNVTRFWVLGKEHADKTGSDKTCFLLNLQQSQEGSLWIALGFFAERKINLLLIYPIPIPGKFWEYTFLVEYAGHIEDPKMDEAWRELKKAGLYTIPARFFGSYPNATSQL